MQPPRAPAPHRPGEKLAVLLPGLGAVATTFIAGVEAVRRGLGDPVGSLTQLGHLIGPEGTIGPPLREALPLAPLGDLVIGGWDPIPDDAWTAALRAGVLERRILDSLREPLEAVRPMPALFDRAWVRRLDGPNVKRGTLRRKADALVEEMRGFLDRHGCARGVVVWTGSTEVFSEPGPVHATIEAFEAGLDAGDGSIAPSQVYAWAAIEAGLPFVNGAPNLAAEIPALRQLAEQRGVPTAGKDLKTGQTLLKTAIAPMLRARLLGLDGWFSANILGNRDGQVLDDAQSFRTKEVSKLGVLEQILDPRLHPELYGEIDHRVAIHYYPPRGDAKEGWDAIDLFGWLGYRMQIKVDFQCRDSILAAPLVLDLALLVDLARRAGLHGTQEWLSFFFKSPVCAGDRAPVHDLFQQEAALHARLHDWAERAATPPLRAAHRGA